MPVRVMPYMPRQAPIILSATFFTVFTPHFFPEANYRKEGTRVRPDIIIIAVKTLRNYSNIYRFLQLFYRTVCM